MEFSLFGNPVTLTDMEFETIRNRKTVGESLKRIKSCLLSEDLTQTTEKGSIIFEVISRHEDPKERAVLMGAVISIAPKVRDLGMFKAMLGL